MSIVYFKDYLICLGYVLRLIGIPEPSWNYGLAMFGGFRWFT